MPLSLVPELLLLALLLQTRLQILCSWLVLCSTHVDDLFPVENKSGKFLRDKLWENLVKEVEVNNLGEIKWALQTSITTQGVLTISQESFTRALLEEAGHKETKGVDTPAVETGADAMCHRYLQWSQSR